MDSKKTSSKNANRALNALVLAEGIVRQHNLLSTASQRDKDETLKRLLTWWNYIAVPAIEGKECPTEVPGLAEEIRDIESWVASKNATRKPKKSAAQERLL